MVPLFLSTRRRTVTVVDQLLSNRAVEPRGTSLGSTRIVSGFVECIPTPSLI
jgi:hypothetical protein